MLPVFEKSKYIKAQEYGTQRSYKEDCTQIWYQYSIIEAFPLYYHGYNETPYYYDDAKYPACMI
jgi:hypothetical protein